MGELQRVGRKVGRLSTISKMTPALSEMKREIESWSDDSFQAAVKGIVF